MSPFGLFGRPNVEKLEAKGDVRGLIKALAYEKDEQVRASAATALGQIGDIQAVEPLVAKLTDADSNVRRSAAKALRELGAESQAIELLLPSLRAEDKHTRWGAVLSLEVLGGPQIVEPLVATVNRDRDDKVRGAAASAIMLLGPTAVEPLTGMLSHKDWRMRMGAVAALGALGAKGYSRLVVEPLIVALEDWHSEVRAEAEESLRPNFCAKFIGVYSVPKFTTDTRVSSSSHNRAKMSSIGSAKA